MRRRKNAFLMLFLALLALVSDLVWAAGLVLFRHLAVQGAECAARC